MYQNELSTRKMLPKISVVFRLYENFSLDRVFLTIQSLKLQKKIDLEIIVSEEGKESKFQKNELVGVTHIFQKNTTHKYNMGKILNRGAIQAKGDFLYFNESDILLLNSNYLYELTKIINTSENMVLLRPPLIRLPQSQFEKFLDIANNENLIKAIQSLDFSQKFIATLDEEKKEIQIGKYFGKNLTNNKKSLYFFSYLSEDFYTCFNEQTIIPNNIFKALPFYMFMSNKHWGGMFIKKNNFLNIGGYCENYFNWGVEDSDIQWKICQCLAIKQIPNYRRFKVLHLDHIRNHINYLLYQINRKTFLKRQNTPIQKILKKDISTLFKHFKNFTARNECTT